MALLEWTIPRRQGSFGSIHRESGRIPSQWVGAINRYGWAESIGMGGRLPSEWVGGINRNHRAESIGITGRIGSEYAVKGREVGKGVHFQVAPDVLHRIEFRRVGRK